jgi:cytochrome P450
MKLFTEEMRRDPFPVLDRLRGSSPLHVPDTDLWMLFDYPTVKRVLTDHEAFSSSVARTRGHGFEWLLFMDPPRHTELRALILKAFTPRSIAALEPRIRELSGRLLDRVAERGELDLVADYAAPLPAMVIAEMIGIPRDDGPRLEGWSEAIMGLADTIIGTPEESAAASDRFDAADADMRGYLDDLVRRRRAQPVDDLLSRLVELSFDETVRFFQLLLAAGTETTTNLIDNAIVCLLDHPEQLAALRARPELLPGAIEEVLRFRSPGQAMMRAPTRDVEIAGQRVPAGAMVLALIGSANRDPAHFADAGRFQITRDPNPHLAFGHGIHFCLGAALARLEGRVALGDLLRRFARIAHAGDGRWPPRRPFNVHGPARLPLIVEPA